jgi:hypothetical protein
MGVAPAWESRDTDAGSTIVARSHDRNRSLYAGLAFGTLVVLALAALILSMSRTAATAPVWGAALIVGTLVSLVALLLLEPQPEVDPPERTASSCAACGKPTLEEWRLCPYCGQMLECDMSLPMGGERIHG